MSQKQLIPVELLDGTVCEISKGTVDAFLTQGRVIRFKRSEGWIVVGRDPLRNMTTYSIFSGADRREIV